MKYLAFLSILLCTALSSPALAEFSLHGPVKLILADGAVIEKSFGFAFLKEAEGYIFQLGEQKLDVAEVPKRYSFSIVMNKKNLVWAMDFDRRPVQAFDWQIGDHHLKLYKEAMQPARPGDFVFEVDGFRHYFIENRPIQVHFMFSPSGISELRVEGTFKPKR